MGDRILINVSDAFQAENDAWLAGTILHERLHHDEATTRRESWLEYGINSRARSLLGRDSHPWITQAGLDYYAYYGLGRGMRGVVKPDISLAPWRLEEESNGG